MKLKKQGKTWEKKEYRKLLEHFKCLNIKIPFSCKNPTTKSKVLASCMSDKGIIYVIYRMSCKSSIQEYAKDLEKYHENNCK